MRKTFILKSLLLLCALIAGSSSVWATEKTENVTLSGGNYSDGKITWTLGSGITIEQLKGTSSTAVNSSYISSPRLYKGHILSFTAATDYTIKSISITYSVNYSGNSMTAGTTVSDNVVTDNTTDVSRTWATTTGGTHEVSSVSSSGLSQIYIQNVSSGANTQLRPTAISITYIAPDDAIETATVTISSTTIYVNKTATVSTNGPAVTLTTSDNTKASVSGTTVTGVAAGSATITASWSKGTVGGKVYAAGSKQFNVTVEANNAVTIDDQGNYTFDFTKNYWSIPTDFTQTENNFTSPDYSITLKGTENEGEGYKFGGSYLMLGKQGAYLTLPAFTFDVDKIEVVGTSGASTSVKQNIYVGENAVSTETTGAKDITNVYAIASGYQAAGNIYTIKVNSTHNTQINSIKVYKKGAAQEATVNISLLNILKGESATVTTNGPAVTLTTTDASIASVSGTTITGEAVGTATITATWSAGNVGGVNYLAGSKQFEVTIWELQDGVFDFTKGYAYGGTATASTNTNNTESSTWTSGEVTLSVSGRNVWYNASDLRLYSNNATEPDNNAGNITFTVPSDYVITKIEGVGSSNLTPNVGTKNSSGVWGGKSQSVTFTHIGGSGTIGLTRITVYYSEPTISVTMGSEGYMTYCNVGAALSFDNLEAYVVSAVGDDNVTLTKITKAPANTPVILKGSEGSHNLNVLESADAVGTNKLYRSNGTAANNDSRNVYALASKGDPAVVGFYKLQDGVKVPAGKCYISVNTGSGSAREFLGFGDDATSINAVQDSGLKVNGEVYDLSGRRIQKPTKGLYIQNGKKVVIK